MANYLIVFDLWLQFSRDFAILLFHYDGRVSEWDEFEWSKRAIHVSVRKQAKWCVEMLYYSSHVLVWKMILNFLDYHDSRWYAKRFLHPDIVAAYEYIFIWDEDLGVDHFNGDKYVVDLHLTMSSSYHFLR